MAASFQLERNAVITDPNWEGISGVADLHADEQCPATIVDPNALHLGKAVYRVRLVVP